MRLWHQQMISALPRQQLLGQHRECAALRGRGWGRKHSVVDYVFTHEPERLVAYHWKIMDEMRKRGYNPSAIWYSPNWRGNIIGASKWCEVDKVNKFFHQDGNIYPEHNEEYLNECIQNLKDKGVEIGL